MEDLDVKTTSKGFIETLREQLAELEDLEAAGTATPSTCEMLVDLHDLLDKLDTMLLEGARKILH
jgi:hypothetical protein